VLHARVDTGAQTSSIWATDITETSEGLVVHFASPEHDIYAHEMTFPDFTEVTIRSSMGHTQTRYKVKLPVIIKDRRILATFTLSDRSTQEYPILIGRSMLTGKFIVDVAEGIELEETLRAELPETDENDEE
jgi:hypothetical protein